MKFKTKLYLGLGSFLIVIAILVIYLLQMLDQISVHMNVTVKELTDRVKITSSIQYELANLDQELKGLTSDPPDDILQGIKNNMEISRMKTNIALESLKKMDTREKSQELIKKFETHYETYNEMTQEIMTLKRAGMKTEYENLLWSDMKLLRERLMQNIDLLSTLQEQEMKNELYRTRRTYNSASHTIYIYASIGLLIGMAMTIWLILGMTRNLNVVASVMTSVAPKNGTKLPRIKVSSRDEIGEIAEAFNGMAQALEEHALQEKSLKEEAQENSWLKTKVAEIVTMHPKASDLQTFARMFISRVTPMVGAGCGVFYAREDAGDQSGFYRAAAYAYHHQGDKDYYRAGEGLVGQCAASNEAILLHQVPEDHIRIVSGTGGSAPSNLLILPAAFEGEVLAVVELASYEPFTPIQHMLLREVMSHIGMIINSINSRMQVESLLHEAQALTEELQSQSEELQMQQEELRTTNEKLEEQVKDSEQKQRELEQIKLTLEEKAQQLALSSQYKSEFLANVSHELRTPLNSLLILTHMLIENTEGNLTAKQLEYARTIHSSGQDLLHLINDILDLAKVESGNLEIVPEEFKLKEIQVFAQSQFSPVARQKGIEFSVHMASDIPKSIYTDGHRLKQILKNLLSNAFKFTEKGSVSLFIHKASPQVFGDRHPLASLGTVLAFSVTDTGIGIPEDKLEVVFESFKQADGTTSRKYGGTGLGLPISREIAKLLGGMIQVNSEVNKGTTFTLYLPCIESFLPGQGRLAQREAAAGLYEEEQPSAEALPRDARAEQEQHPGPYEKNLLHGKKVLIVDDDMRNIFALTTALEQSQMEVIFAQNGREGIERLSNHPDTDLVLMDIMMPEMDGFEAIQAIRRMPPYKDLPIIALTAKAMKQDREQCILAGASDYISKPINLTQLLSLIQVWVYGRCECHH